METLERIPAPPPAGRIPPSAKRARKQRRRRIVFFVLGLVLLAGLGYLGLTSARNARNGAAGLQTATAFRTDLVETISATGSVTAQTGAEVKIGSQVSGTIKHLYADVGSYVHAGQVIAELDLPDMAAQTRQAEATLAQTREGLLQQSTTAGMQTRQNADALRVAQEGLQSALIKRDEAVSLAQAQKTQTATDLQKATSALASARATEDQARKAYDQQVAVAAAALRLAQANARNSAASLARKQHLFAQGFVAASDLDTAQAQSGVDAAQVASAQQNLTLAQTNGQATMKTSHEQVVQAQAALRAARAEKLQDAVKEQQIRDADAAVRQARSQLASAQAGLLQDVAQRHLVAQQQAAVRAQEQQVAYFHDQLDKTYIRSPISGTVLQMAAQQGETLAAGLSVSTVIVVADLDRLEVNAQVDETDIGKVRLGQPASVTVDAFPDQPFTGRVTKIASGSTLQQNVVTYGVTIAIQDPKHRLKPDMTATVVITVGRHKNALVVPNEAIKPDNMNSVVGVLPPGKTTPEKRRVVTGATDGTDTQILSGLRDGDKVVLTGWTPPPDKPKKGGGDKGGSVTVTAG